MLTFTTISRPARCGAVFLAVVAAACVWATAPAPASQDTGAASAAGAAGPAAPASGSRPNIVFIFSDDHAAQAIGAYGSRLNETPGIDRIALKGMVFDNVFCGNSICAPSRATVLTGVHSHVNGLIDNRVEFDGSQPTFPKVLQRLGYGTALFGKWHLKSDPTGFDTWKVLPGQGSYYNPDFLTPDGRRRVEGHSTEVITDAALAWLADDRPADQPFLLMIQYKGPHRNWMPAPEHLGLYRDTDLPEPPTLFDDYEGRNPGAATQQMEIDRHMSVPYDTKGPSDDDLFGGRTVRMNAAQRRAWEAAYGDENRAFAANPPTGDDLVRWKYQRYIKDYLRTVAGIDQQVGRVLDELDRLGLADDTIVVYSSDQGFFLGEHGWYDKRWMYEESARMPFIIRWPGVIEPGSRSDALAQNIDFAPTFIEAAGGEVPERVQGRSLLPLMRGEKGARGERPEDVAGGWRDAIYYRYYEAAGPHNVPEHFGIRTDRYKLIRYPDLDAWELFDLERDPDELRSVHDDAAYAHVRARLERRLRSLQAGYGDDPAWSSSVLQQRRLTKTAAAVRRRLAVDIDNALDLASDAAPAAFEVVGRALRIEITGVSGDGDGVLLAHGGESFGYSVSVTNGAFVFGVRDARRLSTVAWPTAVAAGEPFKLVAVLQTDGTMSLSVNGGAAAGGRGHLLSANPAEGFAIGEDPGSVVGPYAASEMFGGKLLRVRIFTGGSNDAEAEPSRQRDPGGPE